MISKNKLFIFFSISFIVWIFINNFLESFTKSIFVLLIIIVLFFVFFITIKKYLIYLLIIILWFLIWIWLSNYNFQKIYTKQQYIQKNFNKYNNYKLEIIKIYKKWEYNNIYIWKILEINEIKTNLNIKWLLYITKNYNIQIWEILDTKIKLIWFENFNNFNYQKYMLSKKLYFKSYIYYLDIIENKKINIIKNLSLKIKNSFLNTINKIYPSNEAIFLWWILIWSKENIAKDLETNFNNSWLTHLIAVSWFNITIIIIFLSYILQFLPNLLKTIIITFFIIFFTIFVWNEISVIRASIMWLIWYYILTCWREWNILSILCFSIILIIIYSPLSLNYDISLHLSFLAVLWIIYSQEFFKKIFYFLPNFLEIKEAFVLSISSLIFTLPIIIFNFGQLSILSPIANLLVWWTIPFAMLFWFISIIVYYMSNILWIFIWYFAWIFLKWTILMVNFFGEKESFILKYNIWNYDYIIEIIYFLILIFLIIYFRKKET